MHYLTNTLGILAPEHRRGELPPGEERRVQDHLAVCPSCRAEYAAYRRLGEATDALGVARGDVRWAAGLPLTVNAALALEERAWTRRRSAAPPA